MPHQIRPQPGIMDITLYKAGTPDRRARRCAETVIQRKPVRGRGLARAAYLRAGHDLHRYPLDRSCRAAAALAARYGLDGDRIICGVGSDEVITFLCQGFAGPGDEVVYSQHGFLMYSISAMAAGAIPVKAPEQGANDGY